MLFFNDEYLEKAKLNRERLKASSSNAIEIKSEPSWLEQLFANNSATKEKEKPKNHYHPSMYAGFTKPDKPKVNINHDYGFVVTSNQTR